MECPRNAHFLFRINVHRPAAGLARPPGAVDRACGCASGPERRIRNPVKDGGPRRDVTCKNELTTAGSVTQVTEEWMTVVPLHHRTSTSAAHRPAISIREL